MQIVSEFTSKKIYGLAGVLLLIVLAFCLRQVFAGRWILPQYFSVGPVEIHFYGIFMALAVAAGYFLAIKRAAKYGINIEQADGIIFWMVVGGFIGARLYHVLSSFSYYYIHPVDALKIWNGGLSIYGAVIGGVATLLFVRKIFNFPTFVKTSADRQFSIFKMLDWLAPSLILGQIIGRFGNFFNYELYGYPTNLPWKMYVPPQFRLAPYQGFSYFHPLFLYEALANAVILFLLLKIIKPAKAGALFFWYLLLYNAVRFGLEFLRVDSTYFHGIRVNAYASLILCVIASIYLFLPWQNTINSSPSPSA